jgi:dolichyl-phosphate-mannose-protein mannosyltransferase
MTIEGFCDRLGVAVLAVVGTVALLTFRDYGLSWDDYSHSEYGDLLLNFYASGLRDQRALSWVNLYYYGGGFDLLAAAAAKVSPFTLFETRRLMGAAVGIAGLFATWRTGRRIAGPLAGLVALALLSACPLYYGHMFVNPKDAPFAVVMTILLFALVRALEGYPRLSIATGALVGTGFGLAFGSRIMGAFGGLELLGALAFIAGAQARAEGIAAAGSRLLRFTLSLLPAMLLAYLVMALVWPWAVVDPRNPIRALEYFSRFFEKPWSELFAGVVTPVTDMPRRYVPTLLALKLPEIFFALGLSGAAGALVMTARRDIPVTRRAVLLLVTLAALLPLAVAIALRPAMYNGIRHFVFVLPPLAILGGLAAAWLVDAVRGISFMPTAAGIFFGNVLGTVLGTVLVLGLAFPVIEMGRLHPYEYTYFNWLSGGVRQAREGYMLDYWGLSFKQASEALLAKLGDRRENKPSGRRWKIAVCGPHRSPQVELGGDFKTTWDPKGADFAMMLGEFYCRKFDAPLLVEVMRAGVIYARVYDIRGRSYETLLTLPGL